MSIYLQRLDIMVQSKQNTNSMITIIHGDNIELSREYFVGQKKQVQNPITLDGKKMILTDLMQIFEGGGLFEDDKTVFIEDFFSARKESAEVQEIIAYLEKAQGSVYIWERLDVSKLKLVPKKAQYKLFNYPKEIFSFLDSLSPRNTSLIKKFHEVLKTTEAEVIFYLIIRQIRLLLAIKETGEDSIEEVKRLASWQKSKLQKQSLIFTKEQLIHIHDKLCEIDLAQKTGTTPLSLIESIDFLLLSL